jgi:hypothetical protein
MGRKEGQAAAGKNSQKNEEAGSQFREWKDFPKPAARWTLDRV